MPSNEFLTLFGLAVAVIGSVIAFLIKAKSSIATLFSEQKDMHEDIKDISESQKDMSKRIDAFTSFMVDLSSKLGSVESSTKSAHKRIDEQEANIKCHEDLLKEHGVKIDKIENTLNSTKHKQM